MLSYRHAFHAGNHADVLKHLVLVQLLRYLNQKDKPYWFIDTHAGAGAYSLTRGYATQLAEFKDGIARLWTRDDLPAAVKDYVDVIRAANPDGRLRHYPGSPRVALAEMREIDRLRLFELHPSDHVLLVRNLADAGRRVVIQHGDGLVGLKALLPPPPRRALTLIDPSYEVKTDYQCVVQALRDALSRFPGGVFALWYPLLARSEAQKLPARLRLLPTTSWLEVTLRVTAPSPEGIGIHGSGMFIANPPYTLRATLQDALPWLAQALAQDDGAGFTLDSHEA
ncbi:MAG: 23S rRNA (adenine(2030)-N(6))-methyltransferase RlmJ [Sterolibacteriaceae bacterium]|nr:23S rRNA (adenine(2030)-N(6))-methyltransferase RlmJ [Sterolibacteriaceae bacterium]